MKKTLLLLSLFAASLFNIAKADDVAIKNSFNKMNIPVEEIRISPIAGLKMVLTTEGVFYATEDGKYLLQTSIYDVSGPHPVNLTMKELISRVDDLSNEMIVFKSNNEKHVITVFTDPTCGYCVKLQNNIAEYNKQGITVRYLAFPRQGMDSAEAMELQSVWCAKDRKDAFNKVAKGGKVTNTTCDIDIKGHYQLGAQLGVRGTPAIVYKDILMPGYVEPKQLRAMLDSYEASGK